MKKSLEFQVNGKTDLVYVLYHDLKCDINIELYFDHPNDMIEFFSKYNPNYIDILAMEAFVVEDKDV